MEKLKQSTVKYVLVHLTKTDGTGDGLTGVAYDAANLVYLAKDGATEAAKTMAISDWVEIGSHQAGTYWLKLSTTDTNTLGYLAVTINATGAYSAHYGFLVEANSVDDVKTDTAAIKAKTDNLPSDPADESQLEGVISTLQTTATAIKAKTDNLPSDPADESVLEGVIATAQTAITAIKAKTDNLPSDPADASDIAALFATNATAVAAVNTLATAIKAKTDNLPGDPADASDIAAAFATAATALAAVNTLVTAVKAKTDNLPGDPADASDIAAAFATAATAIDAVNTLATAVKAKTDNLPASPAAVGSVMTLTSGERNAISDVVWDELLAGHVIADSTGAALTAAGAAGAEVQDAIDKALAILGLYRVIDYAYNNDGQVEATRTRGYSTKADADAALAALPDDYDTNKVAEWRSSAVYDNGKMQANESWEE